MTRLRRTTTRLFAAFGVAVIGILPLIARPAAADVVLTGAGSTWSAIATQQWIADVARQGLSINFNANGSSAGRVYYYSKTSDFAISEIPFQKAYKTPDGETVDEIANAAGRPYTYLPIVAGGTSFMYHLDVGGQRVTNLRLKPLTLAQIFTGVITDWSDARISADNGGRKFPSLHITPVTRSDGSGTSAQFSAFMVNQAGPVWNAFCHKVGIPDNPCPATSLYPQFTGSVQQSGSLGVSSYVSAGYGQGSIGYVEYGYALEKGFPVASILNHAGYYTQPTAHNVAIALQGASFNADNTQNLSGVYNFNDSRAYPVSSYSYMIAPTTTAAPFTAEKGAVLSKFILYFLCAGQQEAERLGYSPLPKVLVENGFAANNKIPGHVAPPAINQCNNPTITGDFITGAAPPPPPGSSQNEPPPGVPPGGGNTTTTIGNGGGSGGNGGGNGSTGSGNRNGNTTTTIAGSGGGGGGSGNGTTGNPASLLDSGGGTNLQNAASGTPISIHRSSGPVPVLLYVIAVLLILLVVSAPPLLAMLLRQRSPSDAPRS